MRPVIVNRFQTPGSSSCYFSVLLIYTAQVTKEEIERELKPYLVGQYPIAGIYNDQTGEKMSLFNAYKAGIVSRG